MAEGRRTYGSEPQLLQADQVNEGMNELYGVILGDQVVQRGVAKDACYGGGFFLQSDVTLADGLTFSKPLQQAIVLSIIYYHPSQIEYSKNFTTVVCSPQIL